MKTIFLWELIYSPIPLVGYELIEQNRVYPQQLQLAPVLYIFLILFHCSMIEEKKAGENALWDPPTEMLNALLGTEILSGI